MKQIWLAAIGAGCAATVVVAPSAAADTYDIGGSAASVVSNLQAEGYLVQINWTNGFDTKPLELCWVTGVNNPGNLKPDGPHAATVYVDVQCPNHDW